MAYEINRKKDEHWFLYQSGYYVRSEVLKKQSLETTIDYRKRSVVKIKVRLPQTKGFTD